MQYFVRIIEFLKHHLTKGDETAASWVKIFCVSLPQTVTIQRFVHLRNKYTLVLDILKHSLVIHLVNFGRTFVVVLFSSYRAGRGYTEYLRI